MNFRLREEADDKELRPGATVQIVNLGSYELNGAIGEYRTRSSNGRCEITLGPVSTTPGETKSIPPANLRVVGHKFTQHQIDRDAEANREWNNDKEKAKTSSSHELQNLINRRVAKT